MKAIVAGGKIMDVWILTNTFVQSESTSDGWVFRCRDTVVMIGGDAKVIRDDSNKITNQYVEYHYETAGIDYFEYASKILKQREDYIFRAADSINK